MNSTSGLPASVTFDPHDDNAQSGGQSEMCHSTRETGKPDDGYFLTCNRSHAQYRWPFAAISDRSNTDVRRCVFDD